MKKNMKGKGQTNEPREVYLKAARPVVCDGCGDAEAIGKGVTYMRHIEADGSVMSLCPRCIFAVKFRQASTRDPFEVRPGDLRFENLPNRYQSAWTRLRQRLTKDIHNGVKPNDEWHAACEKLIDELGMRHIYERDLMLSRQAEKFMAERKTLEKKLADMRKSIKGVKAKTDAVILKMAKARLELKVAIMKDGAIKDADEAMEELAAAMADLRQVWENVKY